MPEHWMHAFFDCYRSIKQLTGQTECCQQHRQFVDHLETELWAASHWTRQQQVSIIPVQTLDLQREGLTYLYNIFDMVHMHLEDKNMSHWISCTDKRIAFDINYLIQISKQSLLNFYHKFWITSLSFDLIQFLSIDWAYSLNTHFYTLFKYMDDVTVKCHFILNFYKVIKLQRKGNLILFCWVD